MKDENNMPLDVSEDLAQLKVAELIYLKALPRFREMIERGQVRVTFPDHKKVRHHFKHSTWSKTAIYISSIIQWLIFHSCSCAVFLLFLHLVSIILNHAQTLITPPGLL